MPECRHVCHQVICLILLPAPASLIRPAIEGFGYVAAERPRIAALRRGQSHWRTFETNASRTLMNRAPALPQIVAETPKDIVWRQPGRDYDPKVRMKLTGHLAFLRQVAVNDSEDWPTIFPMEPGAKASPHPFERGETFTELLLVVTVASAAASLEFGLAKANAPTAANADAS